MSSVACRKIAPFKGARMASPAGVGGGKGAVIPNEILEEIFMRVDPKTLTESVPKVCRYVEYYFIDLITAIMFNWIE